VIIKNMFVVLCCADRFYSANSETGCDMDHSSYGGHLVAAESLDTPLSASLIPFADLKLHEEIGSGAEGKVSLAGL
jgi:hypothetical protein